MAFDEICPVAVRKPFPCSNRDRAGIRAAVSWRSLKHPGEKGLMLVLVGRAGLWEKRAAATRRIDVTRHTEKEESPRKNRNDASWCVAGRGGGMET